MYHRQSMLVLGAMESHRTLPFWTFGTTVFVKDVASKGGLEDLITGADIVLCVATWVVLIKIIRGRL